MMKLTVSLFSAFAAVLLQVASSMTIDAVVREDSDETARIIAGQIARPGQFPWAASLFKENRFICTCSIISAKTVLTAAHCVVTDGETEPASKFHAIANLRKTSRTVRIDFDSITPHPEYNISGIRNDIAVFQTTGPIPFSDTVKPICIAREATGMMEYENATAMGWGDVIPFRPFSYTPINLQYISLRLISNEECGRDYGDSTLEDYKICAKRVVGGICSGDSGGPLVHLSADKKPVQIGVASYGVAIACGTPFPDVWTRTSSFNSFIRGVAKDDTICEI